MISAPVYNQEGKETEKLQLPEEIFGLKINKDLVAQAYSVQLANSRQSYAHTKDRSEVRGGGKKPWRQKGTGRSRHGSIRSPLWAGGGVTFGPRNEKNFSKKINKQMKKQALFMVLSGKLKDKEIVFVDQIKIAEPKTKFMAEIFDNLKKVDEKLGKGTLLVLPKKDEMIVRASRNIKGLGTIGAGSLNIVDLLSKKFLIMPKEAVSEIKKIYSKKE